MTSVLSSTRQPRANSAFIVLADARNAIFTPLSVVNCAAGLTTTLVVFTPSIAANVGDILLDMGRTVSMTDPVYGNTLLFRKVQYVDPNHPETNGVSGMSPPPGNGMDYNTGYILLGHNGAGGSSLTNAAVAKVAKYGL